MYVEEIKVGEYVRTDMGICKIASIKGTDKERRYCIDICFPNYDLCFVNLGMIKKHSPNIIDLIEVGDIVEIFDVLHNDIIFIWNEEMLKALREDIENGIQIKSITTKEQFNSIKYTVKE